MSKTYWKSDGVMLSADLPDGVSPESTGAIGCRCRAAACSATIDAVDYGEWNERCQRGHTLPLPDRFQHAIDGGKIELVARTACGCDFEEIEGERV